MDTTNQPLPHLALRAAKKLNPKLQCWRWIWFDSTEKTLGFWLAEETPKWFFDGVYTVTLSKKEKPSWTLNRQTYD